MLTIGITSVTPKGGIDSMQHILQKSKKNNSSFPPRIILECTPLHEYVVAIEKNAQGNNKLLIHLLLQSLKSLYLAGADLAIIPNNSSVGVFEELNVQSPIKIVSMTDALLERCLQQGYRSACILGPTPIVKKKIYQKKLEEHRITVTIPDEADQQYLHQEIMDATQNGKGISKQGKKQIEQLTLNLQEKYKFDVFVVACSELFQVFPKKTLLLNPFEILAEKALKEAIS